MSYSMWRWLSFLLTAAAVSLLLHSDSLVRHFWDSPNKVGMLISGPRTDVGDNYYYLTMLRHVPERLAREGIRDEDPDGGDHRNTNAVTDSYAPALYAGYALYQVAAFFTTSSREAVLVTSVLHTTVLIFSFLTFVVILAGQGFRSDIFQLIVLAYIGFVFVDAFGNSLYFGRPYWASNLLTYYLNATRIVNPTLFWAVGLAAAAYVVRLIRERQSADFCGAILLAGLTGLFSISVGATLVLALFLTVAFHFWKTRSVCWQLMWVALVAAAGLAWSYLQLRAYGATPLGQELRHGAFLGLTPKWHFLMLLGLIPFVWRSLGKERVFVAALVVSAAIVGMLCESFHLGDRLWLRGAVIYPWSVSLYLLGRIAFSWRLSNDGPVKSRVWVKTLAVFFMLAFVFQAQRPDVEMWKGFIEREKWELLDWMNAQIPEPAVVVSSDIEDAFLLPIYTQAKPLYAMYGLTNRMRDDELRRFFFNMRLFGRDQQFLSAVLALRQDDVLRYMKHVMGRVPEPYRGEVADAIIFLELVVYHSYVRGFANAFSDPVQHRNLEDMLRSRAEEATTLNYGFDYAIVEKGFSPKVFSEWNVMYSNSRYLLLKNPHSS